MSSGDESLTILTEALQSANPHQLGGAIQAASNFHVSRCHQLPMLIHDVLDLLVKANLE